MKRNRKTWILAAFVLAAVMMFSGQAMAEWKQDEEGAWAYHTADGKIRAGEYFPELELGIAKVGSKYICYDQQDHKVKGLVKNGKDWYYFDNKGRMLIKKRVKIGKYYYYFGPDGKRVRSAWVGKRFYKSNGKQVFSKFVGPRYVGKNGKYVTGLKKIRGVTYYFDKDTGFKVTSKTLKVRGVYYTFNDAGEALVTSENGVPVEGTYNSDPKVDDEDLLAAIIYCEAGNQPYYGQVAVGLVITNRIRSVLFPNTLREVVYAAEQFQPCRNNTLTMALKGQMQVTESCKKAAKLVMRKYKKNSYTIKNAKGKSVSLKGYLFFMTPAAFRRLGIKSDSLAVWDHVFFKLWRR